MFNSGFRGKRAGDNQGTVNLQTSFVQNLYPQPTITGWSISGTDDTALNPAGGQTVLVNGTGFASGVAATVNGSTISPVTLVNPTQISFTSPALAGGSYSLIVYNSTGGAAILVPGLVYSSVPTYTTAAGSIGNIYETNSISTQVIATSDSAITYSLASGSLPSGATLYANGVITGTAPVDSASTTYTFGVTATDAELQDVTRTFTLTINTDTVTWSNPSSNTSISLDGTSYSNTLSATSAAGKSITYTANSLPTGLTLSTATISGTPTVAGTTTTLLTATAATTNRTSQRTITWTVSLSDEYFKYVSLLLSGETTVTPFISDASTNSFGLTIQGDTKPMLFNPYQEGYYSNYFDGTGDYLSAPPNAAFAFGTGDYTLEFWVYSSISWASTICFYNNYAGGYFLQYATGTGLQTGIAGSSATGTYAVTLTSNNWNHIAVSRASGSSKCFVNGTQVGTTVTDNTNYAQTGATIGALYNGSQTLTGYISNLRVVNGTAVYTSNFTPSTAPLTAIANTSLLTCQSNRLIDNSTNNFAITKNGDVSVSSAIPFTQNSSYSTYGSAYFDGTGDYLITPNTGQFAPAGDFSVSWWYYPVVLQTSAMIANYTGNNSTDWSFETNVSGDLLVYLDGSTVRITGSAALKLNQWNYIVVRRSGTTVTAYVNGSAVGSTYTLVGTFGSAAKSIRIGAGSAGTNNMYGYCADVHLINGTELPGTIPTSPLTAIANTSLLTLQYNGGATNKGIIDNSNFNNIITRNGNTSQGTFSPYSVTGWSSYMTSSTTVAPTTNAAFTWGTGDYTIEMWYNPSSSYAAANAYLFDQGSNQTRVQLYNNYVRFFYNNGATELTCTTAGLGLTVGTWYHLAIVRASGVITMYINGTASGSVSSSANETSTSMNIGNYGSGGVGFNGYMSNFRAVKGTAVYTGNFTPSTTPLSPTASTSILTFQSSRYIDNSPNNFALTLSGTPSVQAFDPFGSVPEATPISYSNYFDGTGDYLTIPTNVAFTFGTGDFTIEGWLYMTTVTSATLFDNRTGATSLHPVVYYTGSAFSLYVAGAGAITGPSAVANQWYHVAVSRVSASTKMFINGTQVGSTYADTNSYATSGTVGIGAGLSGGNIVTGYISNLRVIKGTGLYTSTFTPSTTPLTTTSQGATASQVSLLTCQSTRMIDNSTNAFAITAAGNTVPRIFNPFGYTAQISTSYTPSINGGSAYFDGTGDYLTTPNSAFDLTPTTWCIEYWIYPTTIASGYYGLWALSTSGFRQGIYADSGTHYLTVLNGGGGYGGFNLVANNKVVTLNNWQHVALTSNGTTIRQFYNGVQTSTGTAASFTASTPTVGSWGAANYFTGYMSDFRITKGSAIYTSNFVPPTQALSNYSTNYPATLLLNFNNGGIVDLHGSNVLETVGNAQLSTSVKKYNNSSIYFDGTGDYLSIPYGNFAFEFGSGSYTIEFWLYAQATTNSSTVFAKGNSGSLSTEFFTIEFQSNQLHHYVAAYSIASPACASSGITWANTWHHVAVVRNGNTWTMYVDGVSQSTTTTGSYTITATSASNPSYIGTSTYSTTRTFTGYIDDLRITKGYARYTANFTPPTGAFITK